MTCPFLSRVHRQLIFPEHNRSNRALDQESTSRASIGRMSLDHGAASSSPVSPNHPRSNHQRHRTEASRNSLSILQFVQTGDVLGLEQFMSKLSPFERELVFAADAVASNRNPVLVAVKLGNLAVVQSILKWLSEKQVRELWFCTEAE